MGQVGKSGNNAKSVELSKLLSKLKHVTKFDFLRINRTMKLINRIVSRSFHTFINKFVHLFKIKSIRFIKFHPSCLLFIRYIVCIRTNWFNNTNGLLKRKISYQININSIFVETWYFNVTVPRCNRNFYVVEKIQRMIFRGHILSRFDDDLSSDVKYTHEERGNLWKTSPPRLLLDPRQLDISSRDRLANTSMTLRNGLNFLLSVLRDIAHFVSSLILVTNLLNIL